jgi:uncharacterized protein
MSEPRRTCCACREKRGKKELRRYVWRDGEIVADPAQILPGRGAYCCGEKRCQQLFFTREKLWKRVFRL